MGREEEGQGKSPLSPEKPGFLSAHPPRDMLAWEYLIRCRVLREAATSWVPSPPAHTSGNPRSLSLNPNHLVPGKGEFQHPFCT